MAATHLARREAAVAAGGEEIARKLGYPTSTPIRIVSGACTARERALPGEHVAVPPELELARARLDVASGAVELAGAAGSLQLTPQMGVRRTGGNTGLYLGLQTTLPIFNRGSGAVSAARSEELAAVSELTDAESRWDAATSTARRTLAALERAGSGFDSGWFGSVEQTVIAAEARFELGESTLAQLLDARRARLQALEDYARWQAEWWEARTGLAVLEGAALEGGLLCTDPYREDGP
jgi:cobalt-zinc-cadmium efflux system outer membrane protein